MHALASKRLSRIFTLIIPALFLTGCFGEGEGQVRIFNEPVPPEPPVPPGFCDPINFEPQCPADSFTNFEGGVITVENVADLPAEVAAGNDSVAVGRMLKFAAESGATFGGSTINLTVPFTGVSLGSSWTMRVYATREVRVLLQPEPQGPGTGVEITHGGTGWETLTFPMPTLQGTVSGMTLIFDNGRLGDTAGDPENWTFYFDDITLVPPDGGGGPGPGEPFTTVTFDDPAITYALRGFGGAEDSTLQADPDDAGNTVVQVNRSDAAETFAGTVASTGANESVGVIPLDAMNTTMTLRVRSPAAGITVRLKIENSANDAISVETEAVTTIADGWETLTFDFANEVDGTAAFDPAATYDKTVIFFNFGVDGATAGAQTFYFDDIDVGSGGGGPGPTPFTTVTFDDPAITYALRGFGGAEDSTLQADPDDAGNTVVQVNRSDAAETFAGTVASTGANESVGVIPLDAMNTTMTLRVRSPAAGITVRLKIENSANDAISVETEAVTTVADGWETLTFDFANEVGGTAAFDPAATYDKTVIFFNFGVDGATAGAQTFYFDDIDVGAGGGGPAFPTIGFDDPAITYALRGFGGAEDSTVVVDPTDASNMAVQVNRSAAAETFAGTVVSTGPNETVPVIPLDAMNTQMSVRVWSPEAGITVRLKIESSADPAISVETEAVTTVAGDWETLTFNFLNEVPGTPAFDPAATYDRIVIFFNFGVDGATAGAQTFYFDDIMVVAGNGGGGGPGPAPFTTITFDDPAVTYTLRGFGGAEGSFVTNDPAGGTNMVVQVDRSATAETFAGTVVSTGPNETIEVIPLDAMNTEMNVRVYSAQAGVQVRLKIENSADPAVSVETEATTTTSGAWETLTFDFLNEAAGTPAFDPAATYDKAVIFFNFGVDGATAGAQTYYFDDIAFGPGAGASSFVNGDFEANGGSLDDWTLTLVDDVGGGLGSITADSSGQGGRAGTVARLAVTGSAASFNDAVISQGGLGQGTVMAGDTISVTFDLYGTVTQPGAATFVEVIFLDANGQDVGGRDFLNSDPTPYTATTTWTNYSGTVTAGTGFVPNPGGGPYDVSGGVVLSLKVSCGPVDGCAQDVSFDNVTFTIN